VLEPWAAKSPAANAGLRIAEPGEVQRCSQYSKMHTEISMRKRIRSTATAVALLFVLLHENRAVATTAIISSASATTAAATATSVGIAKLVAAQVVTRDFTWFPFPDVGTPRLGRMPNGAWPDALARSGRCGVAAPSIREDRHRDSREAASGRVRACERPELDQFGPQSGHTTPGRIFLEKFEPVKLPGA